MIEINGNNYNLCLFDTNTLSSLLQKPKNWINYFNSEFSLSKSIICYSAFSLSELFYRQELFEIYTEIFSGFPSAILDGHESIFNKELKNYSNEEPINPIIIAPFAIKEKGLTAKEKLLKVIKNSNFIPKTEYWKSGQKEILSGIIDLKKNYPPKNNKYTKSEIEDFNFIVSTSQIGIRNMRFAKDILSKGTEINLKRFPSLISTSYFVFYKFYPDDRKPINSDVFDIIISSLLPYVDYFISEGNMCEIITRIQKNHDFLNNVKPYKLKVINKKIDDYT